MNKKTDLTLVGALLMIVGYAAVLFAFGWVLWACAHDLSRLSFAAAYAGGLAGYALIKAAVQVVRERR